MKFLYVLIVITTLILSCTPTAYYPSKLAPPHFSGEGNLQATVAMTSSAEYAFQAGFSPLNHFGVYYLRNGHISGWTKNKHSVNEVGMGTYYWFGNNYYMGLYGGYSNGYVNARSNSIRLENKFNQYSCGLVFDKKEKNVITSIGLRAERHEMRDYKREDRIFKNWKNTYGESLTNIYLSPSIARTYTTSSGGIQIRFVGSFPTKKSIDDIHFYISGGLFFDFKIW